MIDTYNAATVDRLLNQPEFDELTRLLTFYESQDINLPEMRKFKGAWYVASKDDPLKRDGYRKVTYLTHAVLGVRVGVHRRQVLFVSASLPRLLFGCNGRLIINQEELSASLAKLRELLDSFSTSTSGIFRPNRIDLVQHAGIPIHRVRRTYQLSRPAGLRKEPILAPGSIRFKGHKLEFFFYDKEAEMKVGRDRMTRFEVRLRSKQLLERHGLYSEDLAVDFCRAYQAFTKLIWTFPSIPQANGKDLADFLAIAYASDRQYGGVKLYDAYLDIRCKNRQAAERVRRQVAERIPSVTKLRLEEVFPPNCPPPPLHVLPKPKAPNPIGEQFPAFGNN